MEGSGLSTVCLVHTHNQAQSTIFLQTFGPALTLKNSQLVQAPGQGTFRIEVELFHLQNKRV